MSFLTSPDNQPTNAADGEVAANQLISALAASCGQVAPKYERPMLGYVNKTPFGPIAICQGGPFFEGDWVPVDEPRKPMTMGDLVVALAVYGHAGTDDFKSPLPERDLSAIAIRYFTKNPELLTLTHMRAAFTVFLWDASNRRQHERLDKLKEVYALATEAVQDEFLQLFADQVVWVRRHDAGEFK